MDCVVKELVTLDKGGICPFSGQKCDGTLKINWQRDYVLLPECKTCISRGKHGVFIEVSPADIEKVGSGMSVLMIQAGGNTVFVKVGE